MLVITGPDGERYTQEFELVGEASHYSWQRLADFHYSAESWSTNREACEALERGGLEFIEGMRAIAFSCILKTRAIDEKELWAKFQKLCDKRRIMPIWGQLANAIKEFKRCEAVKFTGEPKKIIRA